jgi:hypothetical protein
MPTPRLPDLPSKDQIAGSLLRHTWLEQAVLVLLYDRRFRFAFLTLLLIILFAGASLLRVWRVTPEGFVPTIRISALDFVQSLSLARTAARETAAENGPASLSAWMAAVRNNPADPGHVRGLLAALGTFGDRRRHTPVALRQTEWLLHLAQTNAADVALAARTLHALWLNPEVLDVLKLRRNPLPEDLQILHAKVLFLTFDPDGFAVYLPRFRQLAETGQDPEAALIYHAYRAGWTDGLSQTESQSVLDQGKLDTRLAVLAHRLQLIVSYRRNDPQRYADSLEFLRNRADASVVDFGNYWLLLSRNGRRAEAVDNAHSNVLVPETPNEAILLARAHFELGHVDSSHKLLSQYARYFAHSEHVWLSYANLLVDQRAWPELLEAGSYLQFLPSPERHDLRAFAFFLQGLANHHLRRPGPATEAFDRAARFPVASATLGSKMADTFQQLGYFQHAQRILDSLRQTANEDPNYWRLVATTAFALKDTSLLVFATATLYRLSPDSTAALQDYAAALLTTRTLPADAVKLTFLLVSRSPGSVPARLNHAAALAQNNRFSEARDVLGSLAGLSLSASERNAAQLAWFEVYFAGGDDVRALATERTIDRSGLFPPETAWLDSCLKTIKGRTLRPAQAPSAPGSTG